MISFVNFVKKIQVSFYSLSMQEYLGSIYDRV